MSNIDSIATDLMTPIIDGEYGDPAELTRSCLIDLVTYLYLVDGESEDGLKQLVADSVSKVQGFEGDYNGTR